MKSIAKQIDEYFSGIDMEQELNKAREESKLILKTYDWGKAGRMLMLSGKRPVRML